MTTYTPRQRQRIHHKAKHKLGKINKDNPQDKLDFMEQCLDAFDGVDDAENICEMLWMEGSDE